MYRVFDAEGKIVETDSYATARKNAVSKMHAWAAGDVENKNYSQEDRSDDVRGIS